MEAIKYCVTIGNEYQVFAVALFNNEVRYLIAADDNIPYFFPSALFEIGNQMLPFDWEIAEYKLCLGKIQIIGYSKLTNDYTELRNLVNCTPEAIETFLAYKESSKNMYG